MPAGPEHGAEGCTPAQNEQSIEFKQNRTVEDRRALFRKKMEEVETTSIAGDATVSDAEQKIEQEKPSVNFIEFLPGGNARRMISQALHDNLSPEESEHITHEMKKFLAIDLFCLKHEVDPVELARTNAVIYGCAAKLNALSISGKFRSPEYRELFGERAAHILPMLEKVRAIFIDMRKLGYPRKELGGIPE
ncbi:MAG TPA: hypothetical protein VHA78_04980 [Candidatus Peribacteraceae bacterium]|nr:hypothetical protein [Candidatus Peribacteraceae bacterium]